MATPSREEIKEIYIEEIEHTTPYEILPEAIIEAVIQGNANDKC